jgi:hypothetical protein
MTETHAIHEQHSHQDGPNGGYTALTHNRHTDSLHDGHLRSLHERHLDEHSIEVSVSNPETCTPNHTCEGHEQGHKHGPGCGHEAVSHGDHVDYLVAGHLHHPHGNHCDTHGDLQLA